jgi:hypothetical protein
VVTAAFHRHIKNKESEVFVTSLHEIDRIIDHKRDEKRQAEEEELGSKVPVYYHDYLDFFSKEASDALPPSRPNDYKIELESELTLGCCPLYKLSLEELEAARQYIIENLNKGFIEPSSALFASPILMAKKPGGGLRFC